MKANFLFWIILIALSSMMFQGYQCGSTEMTSAKLYIQQKNYDAAIKNLEGEVQKNPGNEEAWYLLGGLKADKMDYTGMNFAFSQALKLADKHSVEIRSIRYNKWGVHLNNGVSYLDRASSDSTIFFEKSLEEFQKAALAWPDTALTYRYLGYAYNNMATSDASFSGLQEMAHVTVKMEKEGGVFYVPCRVNGLDLKFVFDTGASIVSISLTEASFMLKNGYLDKKDIIGKTNFMDASGNIAEGTRIMLKKIDFAGLTIENVEASVVLNQKAPLLLGQSAIEKLGKFEFDAKNATLTIKGELRGWSKTTKLSLFDNALKAFNTAWEKGKDVESLKRAGRIYLQRAYDHKSKFEGDNAGKLKTLKDLDDVKKGSSKNDVMRTLGAPDDVKKGARGTKKEEWTYKNYSMKLSIDGDKVTQKSFTSPYKSTVDSTESRLAMKEFDNAIHALEQVKDADPADNDNLSFLLRAYVESAKIKEAIKTYQQAAKNDPKNKQVHYLLGVLYRTDGDFTKAISEFEEAQKIDPNFADAIFDLGATYYNWGVDIIKAANDKGEDTEEFKEKFKKALPYMEKVSGMKKDDPSVWETLGTMYARLGQSDKAKIAFEEADWLRKKNLKIGMSETDVVAALGEPEGKTEVVYENLKSIQWVYDKGKAICYFTDGKLKGWVRDVKSK